MARSHSIWIVLDDKHYPIISFTVKHECVSWLRKNGQTGYASYVKKMPDGWIDSDRTWLVGEFLKDFG